jgi:hypothetical protein
MLQKVFKSVIIAWLFLLVFCLVGGFSHSTPDSKIIIALVVIPFAGGLSGFVIHLLDRSKYRMKFNPLTLNILKLVIFLFLVGIAFVFGLNG